MYSRRTFFCCLLVVFALVMVGCEQASVPTATTHETAPPDPAPLTAGKQSPSAAPDEYIVVFKPGVGDPSGLARQLVASHNGRLRFTYTRALKGFAARLSSQAVEALRHNPNVAYVEPDAHVRLYGTQNNPPSWGVDRIDQRDLPLSASYTYPNDGSSVNVYILDTGVRASHQDFGGRVQYVANGNNGDFVGDGHGSAEDCHGHGTHVAGSAAGSSYGVAKNATIWAARVVNCSGGGQVSMAIAAVDWITQYGQQPAVVNMSLGYGDVQSLRDAVEASIAAGFNYAVAAGNGNFAGIPQDACSESPAGAPNALTIGATASDDTEASFSNYGTCVDLLAPGVSITSAWYTSDNATATISGTSMATPHVAGAVALYLSANPSASPAEVANALVSSASANKISLHSRSRRGGTPNLLLYTSFIGGDDGGTANDPPTASFTYTCADLACNFDASASTDSDGTIAGYTWDFGDGATASGVTASHTYVGGGTYTVTLTVTDDDGAADSEAQNVTVNESGTGGISLTASGYKVKGLQKTDLSWSGATSTDVDVYRDGALVATTANDGAYTDPINQRGGGSYTYQVCEAGTTTCSNESTVTF